MYLRMESSLPLTAFPQRSVIIVHSSYKEAGKQGGCVFVWIFFSLSFLFLTDSPLESLIPKEALDEARKAGHHRPTRLETTEIRLPSKDAWHYSVVGQGNLGRQGWAIPVACDLPHGPWAMGYESKSPIEGFPISFSLGKASAIRSYMSCGCSCSPSSHHFCPVANLLFCFADCTILPWACVQHRSLQSSTNMNMDSATNLLNRRIQRDRELDLLL